VLPAAVAQAADSPPGVSAVTNYATYPASEYPAGCFSVGSDIVTNEQFRVNGGPPASSMAELSIAPGDVITMTWDGFAPGCEQAGISLAIKIADAPGFDASSDQYLSGFDYCGPAGSPCTAPHQLTLDTSALAGSSCFQLDATIGRPLNIVGPSGSFYALNSPINMLISAHNGGVTPCVTPPCATNPQLPAGALECAEAPPPTNPPPTNPPPTQPPATQPPVTQPPPSIDPPPSPRPTTPTVGVSPTSAAAPVVTVATGRTLAVTGPSQTTVLALVGAALILAGAGLAGFSSRARAWADAIHRD